MANNQLTFANTQVKGNKVGASSADVLEKGVIECIGGNETEFNKDYNGVAQALPASPEIPGIESRPVNANDKIADLIAQKEANENKADSTQNPWSLIGSVSLDNHYHHIKTRKVKGERTSNSFQVPGFGTDASIYLLMQSTDGKSIELNADISANSWNYFSPDPITLTYTDNYNKVVLGDFTKVGGDLYMASLPIFGVGYTLSLFKNNANQSVLELNGFFGENRKPYLIGDRHPDIYKNYIGRNSRSAPARWRKPYLHYKRALTAIAHFVRRWKLAIPPRRHRTERTNCSWPCRHCRWFQGTSNQPGVYPSRNQHFIYDKAPSIDDKREQNQFSFGRRT